MPERRTIALGHLGEWQIRIDQRASFPLPKSPQAGSLRHAARKLEAYATPRKLEAYATVRKLEAYATV